MVISFEHKYIFIEVPKTGTTSIRNFLMKNDPTAERKEIVVKNKKYQLGIHTTALEMKNILGEELFDSFKLFAFIRNPQDRVVSIYSYYSRLKGYTTIGTAIKISLTKFLPLELWSLLIPYSSNFEYLQDKNGNIIVDYIGDFENINEDFNSFIKQLNLKFENQQLPRHNTSKHDKSAKYFSNNFFRYLMSFKIKADMSFYESYK